MASGSTRPYFGTSEISGAWYPRARKRAAGAAFEGDAEPIKAPRTRVFTWVFNQTASSRRTLAFPRCVGPALIKDCTFYRSTGGSPVNETFEIGYSKIQQNEAGVALTTPRPYTVLTELHDPFAAVADAAGAGIPLGTIPNTHVRFFLPLDLVVNEPEFFPVIALVNNSLNAQEWNGHLRVIEDIDREAIRFFL